MRKMNHEKFCSDLRKLHTELRTITSLDKDEEDLLRQLDSDLESLLSRDYGSPADHETRKRLGAALAVIETAHPKVTLIMSQMVDSLAYLGV